MTRKKKIQRGGLINPALVEYKLNMSDADIVAFVKAVSTQLKETGKVIVPNFAVFQIVPSTRKVRFDYKKQEWVKVKPKRRLAVKMNTSFRRNVLD